MRIARIGCQLASVQRAARVGGLALLLLVLAGAAQADSPLFIMNADGTAPKRLFETLTYPSQGNPDFSHDGTKIAFDAWTHEADMHIMVSGADGKDPKDMGPGAMPAWSPDDKQLAVHSYTPRQGVFVMNADGVGREWLCRGFGPRWSPDGSLIASVGYHEATPNIYIFDTVEATQHKLLAENYVRIALGICFSPDGKQIAFRAVRPDGSTELAIASVEIPGSPVKVRYRGEVGWRPSWSPDGAKLLIPLKPTKDAKESLHTLSAAGEEAPVAIPGQDSSRNLRDPTWSPDGKRIAYTSSSE